VLQTLEDPTPGYKDLWKPTHKRLCDFVQKYAQPGQKVLILLPRGWVKSYIITVGWLIQRTLKNLVEGKHDHWIISNATVGNASEFLDKIKYNLQYNEILTGLFGEFLPKTPETEADRWTMTEIGLLGNKIETGSVEGNLVSRHYRGMINDDLVNKDNSATAEQNLKVIDWWKLAQSLLESDGVEIILGTRWSMDDLYGNIIEKFLCIPKEEMENFKTKPIFEWHQGKYHLFQASCWLDPVNRTGSTFPTKFPESRLKEIESEQAERFGGQYLNDPLAMTASDFKLKWFSPRWREDELPAVANTFMLVDPTAKEKAESDATGLVVVKAGLDKKCYVTVAKHRLVTDLKLADWIIEEALLGQPGLIGIEENKFASLSELIEIRLPVWFRRGDVPKDRTEYAKTIPNILIELKHHNRSKALRIRNLTGWFEGGRILLAPWGMEILIDELLRFPASRYDDIADALSYLLDVLIFPTEKDAEVFLTLSPDQKMTEAERIEAEWDGLAGDALIASPRDLEDENALW
jgi:hypothetical protein